MNTSNIIVVPKMSKYEWDMKRKNFTHDQAIESYKKSGKDTERILSSHYRQKESLAEIKKYLDERQFVEQEKLSRDVCLKADMIIALGGDNHLQYVSHYVDETPVLGINSDPVRSHGGLLDSAAKDFEAILKKIEADEYEIEYWTRLKACLDGKELPLAVSEFLIAENRRRQMTRYIIEFDGKSEEQQSSGVLIATGAGSTGWYDSEYKWHFHATDRFPRTADYAHFIVTSPFYGYRKEYSILSGVLERGQKISFHSLNDDRGIVTPDCWEDFDFDTGSKVVIALADRPLQVVKIPKS